MTDDNKQETQGIELEELSKVKQICNLMNELPFNELEYEETAFRLKIVKESPSEAPTLVQGASLPLMAPGHSPAMLPAPAGFQNGQTPTQSQAPMSKALEDDPNLHKINSPISGTFYEAPNPGAEPFVKVGQRVEVGQVVCIMEAMKIMNEIKSEVAGEVVKVCFKNEEGVASGETLFLIR